MKSVKSVADLQRHALATGATVRLGTSRFNSTGDKMTPAPVEHHEAKVERAPETFKAPEPPVIHVTPHIHVDVGDHLRKQVGDMLTTHESKMRAVMNDAVSKIPVNPPTVAKPETPAMPVAPAKAKGYRLQVHRDSAGRMTHAELLPHDDTTSMTEGVTNG